MFRFYYEVARTMFRRQLIYQWANLGGLFTNVFFGAIFSFVIIALYQVRSDVAGLNLLDTLRYTWLTQSMIMVVLPFGWFDLMMTIRTGEVVGDLSKPCDFYWYWFGREMGRNCYYLLFRAIPVYVAGMLLFGFGFPLNAPGWLGFALTLVLAAMLGIAYRFLYNIVAFWLVEARAFVTLSITVALFFTGSYIPIPFLPSWVRTTVEWLPFNGMLNLPTMVLLGKIGAGTFWFELVRQMGWLVVFTLGCFLLTKQALRRVVSQGG
jgi:ABC-2 type transport system permease protein